MAEVGQWMIIKNKEIEEYIKKTVYLFVALPMWTTGCKYENFVDIDQEGSPL